MQTLIVFLAAWLVGSVALGLFFIALVAGGARAERMEREDQPWY